MIKGTVWSKINCDTIQHTLTKQNLGFYVKLASVHIFKAPYIPDDIACVADEATNDILIEVGFYESVE